MDRRPTWLRNERSYRFYLRGLRYAVLGGFVAVAFGLLAASGVIGLWAPLVVSLAGFGTAAASVVISVVGWFCVPHKKRLNAHQIDLLRMVAHDRVRRIPPGPKPRTMQDLADQMRAPGGIGSGA